MKLELDKQLLKSLLVLGSLVEARDAYTGGHLWRVSQYAKFIAEKIGLSKEEVFIVAIGGFLHDIGKIGVSDSILQKSGPLDDKEYNIIKTHPKIGSDLIREHPLAALSHEIILHHHEHYNGNGYPDKQSATEISLFSRIVGIADAFDAMTSTRPYRVGMSYEKAVAILENEKDKQFDGKIISAFLSLPTENIMHIIGHSEPGIPLMSCVHCGPTIVLTKKNKDGDHVICKACGGKYVLHKSGSHFEREFVKGASADEIKPEAEMTAIGLIIQESPQYISVSAS